MTHDRGATRGNLCGLLCPSLRALRACRCRVPRTPRAGNPDRPAAPSPDLSADLGAPADSLPGKPWTPKARGVGVFRAFAEMMRVTATFAQTHSRRRDGSD